MIKLFLMTVQTLLSILVLVQAGMLMGCAAQQPQVPVEPQDETARLIEEGDDLFLTYTCYLKDGKMAATTDPVAAEFSAEKSDIFLPSREPGPVLVTAGDKAVQRIHTMVGPENFERAVSAYLARAIVGGVYDREFSVEISGEIQKGIKDSERYLKLNRHQPVKKINRIDVSKLESIIGAPPVVGGVHPVRTLPGVSIRIVELDRNDAVIETVFPEGMLADDAFGKKRFVSIDAGSFKTVIETEIGHLVRSGALVGRVAEIDDQFITMDYGDPFGGADLACEVSAKGAGGD